MKKKNSADLSVDVSSVHTITVFITKYVTEKLYFVGGDVQENGRKN